MNPNLSFTSGAANATAGNPNLKAFRTQGGDLGIDFYHSDAGFVSVAAFYRKLNGLEEAGFYSTGYNGRTFLVQTQINAGKAHVSGVEVTANERLVFLPEPLSNLGFEVNYTYIDGAQQNPAGGADLPLSQQPKSIFNVSGFYDLGRFSARLNYSHRGEQFAGVGNANLPIGDQNEIVAPQNWLDFSLRYRLTDNFELTGNGTNLTDPNRREFASVQYIPNVIEHTGRRYALGIRFKY